MIKESLPKVGIKLLKISHVRILFLVSLLFVAVINPFKFLIFKIFLFVYFLLEYLKIKNLKTE